MKNIITLSLILLLAGQALAQEKKSSQKKNCLQNKYVLGKQVVYSIRQDTTTYILEYTQLKGSQKAKITESPSYVSIKFDKPLARKSNNCSTGATLIITDYQAPLVFDVPASGSINNFYFPAVFDKFDACAIPKRQSLWYFDTKPSLQALTIPLKIRPALNDQALKDSFPSQAEAGFSIGLSFGWKFNFNVITSQKDIFDQNIHRVSITPGFVLGSGVTELKKANTRNPVIEFERKAAVVTTGGFIMVGFDRFNVGYSFGADWATGKGSGAWLYQGRLWHGIILALDIIK